MPPKHQSSSTLKGSQRSEAKSAKSSRSGSNEDKMPSAKASKVPAVPIDIPKLESEAQNPGPSQQPNSRETPERYRSETPQLSEAGSSVSIPLSDMHGYSKMHTQQSSYAPPGSYATQRPQDQVMPNVSQRTTRPTPNRPASLMGMLNSQAYEAAGSPLPSPGYVSSLETRQSNKGGMPQVPNKFIKRQGSSRLSPTEYTVEEYNSADKASEIRVRVLKDWIYYHDFREASSDGVRLVDWAKFLPHERIEALHYAEHHARTALYEFSRLKSNTPIGHDDLVSLKDFADHKHGDTDLKNVFNVDDLPDLSAASVGSEARLPRTIVVMAKIYHCIFDENRQLVKEAGKWVTFKGWVFGSEDRAPNPDDITDLGISPRILKDGARWIAKLIDDGLNEYFELRKDQEAKGKPVSPAIDSFDHPKFGTKPKDSYDPCKMTAHELQELELYPGLNSSNSKNAKLRKLQVIVNFRNGLAFRAKTLLQVQGMTNLAKGLTEDGLPHKLAFEDDRGEIGKFWG